MDEQRQILKLAAEIASMDLNELVEGWRRRLLILDSQIEAFRELLKDFQSLYNVLTLRLMDFNILERPETTAGGEKKSKGPPNDEEKDINQELTDWH